MSLNLKLGRSAPRVNADIRALELALRIGMLSNRASLQPDDPDDPIRGDPAEAALLVAGRKAGVDREEVLGRWPEAGSVPFSIDRMLMATLHDGPACLTSCLWPPRTGS